MDDPKKLKTRVEYLEEVNRSRIMALDMIRGLGGLHAPNKRLKDPGVILDTCDYQFRRLIQIRTLAFYLIDETSSDFTLYACYPESDRATLESEMDAFIADGTFSRAVLEKEPVTAASRDFSSHFLFMSWLRPPGSGGCVWPCLRAGPGRCLRRHLNCFQSL